MHQKLLGNFKKGLLFVVSAPAGTGKTTLVNMITREFNSIVRSISYTTRKPREKEIDGIDYFFISESEFKKKIEKGDFLEYAKVFDAYYGTSKEFIEKKINEGKHVILVIDTQGAAQVKEKNIGIFIFISPPDINTLEKRLQKRGDDSKKSIETRLAWVEEEMEQVKYYDYEIINDKLNIAYEVLKSIFIAEEHRIKKRSKTVC